jgi:hypothetical protein
VSQIGAPEPTSLLTLRASCICGYDTDDGFTIQCERCLVWQHCACFGMSQSSVPDEYLCETCDPRPVNMHFAQQHQQKRREAETRKAVETARRMSTSAAWAAAHAAGLPSPRGEATAGSPQTQQQAQPQQPASSPPAPAQQSPHEQPGQRQPPSRGRKPSVSIDLSSAGFVPPESAQVGGKGKKKGTAKSGRKTPGADTPAAGTPRAGTSFAGPLTPLTASRAASNGNGGAATLATSAASIAAAEADERALERLEAWHAEFTPTERSIVAEPRCLATLEAAMAEYGSARRQALRTAGPERFGDRDCWIVQPASGSAPPGDEDIALDSVDPLTPVGGECVPIELSGPSLDALASPTYVKHISEGAAGAIFGNVMSIAPLPSEPSRPWCASRTFSRPVMHGLFADAPIPKGAFITEYRGELLSADKYRADPVNQYHAIGTPKPHVHLFPPPLALAIDARRFGTEARFARSSCHPNAVLRPILFARDALEGADSPAEAEPELLFGIFSLVDIQRTHEITLGWEWDDEHIVHLLPALVKNPALGVPSASTDGEGASSAALAAAAIAAKVASGARTTERERRNAAIAALAERGDFPYVNTRFSASMNAVLAVLLGAALCACIGSAAAPAGQGGHASANNARRQDCAIAQMLRLAQGMSMQNVAMPGSKSHRKIRPPDFEPLVGVRRWWRTTSMPPTPADSADAPDEEEKVDLTLRGLDVPYQTTADGRVGLVQEADYLRAIKDAERRALAERRAAAGDADMDEVKAEAVSSDEDMSDAPSAASSLTEPLSGLTDLEDEEDEDDELRDLIRREQLEEDGSSSLLPLKKRVSGTRLKATYSNGEESDAEGDGVAGSRRMSKSRSTPLPRGQQSKKRSRVSSKASPKPPKARRSRPRVEDSDEDDGAAPKSSSRSAKKRRRAGKSIEPSSPLTSAPDDGEGSSLSDASLSPAPTLRKNSTVSTAAFSDILSDPDSSGDDQRVASSKGSRRRSSAKEDDADVSRTSDLSEAALRARNANNLAAAKLAKARKQQQRMSLADLAESESSGEERQRPSHKQSITKRARSSDPARVAKVKKPRLVISSEDSDGSEDDDSRGTRDRTPTQQADLAARAEVTSSPSQPQPFEPAPAAAPEPAPAPEPARAKLTLAEYKKRLAERRTTEANASAVQTPSEPSVTPVEAAPAPAPLAPRPPRSATPPGVASYFPPAPLRPKSPPPPRTPITAASPFGARPPLPPYMTSPTALAGPRAPAYGAATPFQAAMPQAAMSQSATGPVAPPAWAAPPPPSNVPTSVPAPRPPSNFRQAFRAALGSAEAPPAGAPGPGFERPFPAAPPPGTPGFNPPRGPKALINAAGPGPRMPSAAMGQPTFARPGDAPASHPGARRHSNSFSNASASSMSPPHAMGGRMSVDVSMGGAPNQTPSPSPTLRASSGDFGGPNGPRGSLDDGMPAPDFGAPALPPSPRAPVPQRPVAPGAMPGGGLEPAGGFVPGFAPDAAPGEGPPRPGPPGAGAPGMGAWRGRGRGWFGGPGGPPAARGGPPGVPRGGGPPHAAPGMGAPAWPAAPRGGGSGWGARARGAGWRGRGGGGRGSW